MTTIGCSGDDVKVYDSVFSSITDETSKVILTMLGKESTGSITVEITPKQLGTKDCGLFAIAIATTLATGEKTLMYDHAKMRAHLVKCLDDTHFTPFP